MAQLRLGTRASPLALAQTHAVADQLRAALPATEIVIVEIMTTGDQQRALLDKEKWVKELDHALLAGEIDLAVHSAKDVPGHLPDGLRLVGAPERAVAWDALCGATSLDSLAEGATVGTSSLRRAAHLRAARADLRVVAVRGNVDTRLGRLAAGDVDALVLAAAGLTRLGRADAIDAALEDFVPAPGQGVVVLQGRDDDPAAAAAGTALTDAATWRALRCERSAVVELGATCHTPVGAHCTLRDDGQLNLDVFVGLPDGAAWVRDTVHGCVAEPELLGRVAAARILAAGGRDLLNIAGGMAQQGVGVEGSV